jgi:hypothetical protein
MSAVERNILTVIEPTIVLDELAIPDFESGSDNQVGGGDAPMQQKGSKFSTMVPLIRINQYEIQGDRLEMFQLNCTEFYPTCKFSFVDRDGMFTARHYPKDGDIIQLYIRSQGEETTFKPIRIDFTVEEIKPLGGGGSTDEASKLMVNGRMHVPNLFTEKVQFQDNTSWNALLSMAEELQLGYASNIEDTDDQQIWTNPYDTSIKFMQDIIANSYLNDDSFFTAYIDPYYYLSMVDVNKMFDQEDALETVQTFSQNAIDTLGIGDAEESEYPSPYFLSNVAQYQGTANYISKYQQVNRSGEISKNNGYKRYTQYWDLEQKKFISEFVDPIVGDTPGMVPATKGRLVQGEVEGPRNDQVKYKYLGTQGDNVHANFQYASILNFQNLQEVEKFGMVVELDTVNPAIARYTRIAIQIVEFGSNVKSVLTAPDNDDDVPEDVKRRSDEGSDVASDKTSENGVLNEYLSGFYVVTGIEYILTTPGGIRQKLHLRRREVVPST